MNILDLLMNQIKTSDSGNGKINPKFKHLDIVKVKENTKEVLERVGQWQNHINMVIGDMGIVGDTYEDHFKPLNGKNGLVIVYFDKIKDAYILHPECLELVSKGSPLSIDIGKYYLSCRNLVYKIIYDLQSISINSAEPYIGVSITTGVIHQYNMSGISDKGYSFIREVDKDGNIIKTLSPHN